MLQKYVAGKDRQSFISEPEVYEKRWEPRYANPFQINVLLQVAS
jgi:hypothetical protein